MMGRTICTVVKKVLIKWFGLLMMPVQIPLAFAQAVFFLGAEVTTALPFAIYLALAYLFLAGILGFFRNRLPLGTIFFAYLFFSGFFVSLAEWLRPEKALFGGINLNFLFGAILIGGGLLGVALPLSFWLKRGRRIKA